MTQRIGIDEERRATPNFKIYLSSQSLIFLKFSPSRRKSRIKKKNSTSSSWSLNTQALIHALIGLTVAVCLMGMRVGRHTGPLLDGSLAQDGSAGATVHTDEGPKVGVSAQSRCQGQSLAGQETMPCSSVDLLSAQQPLSVLWGPAIPHLLVSEGYTWRLCQMFI